VETLYRLDPIGKLISQKKLNWFTPPLYSAEAKRILTFANDFLFKTDDFTNFVLEHGNKDYIVKIYHLVKSSTGMNSKKKASLLKSILEKYPDIDKIKTEEDFVTSVTVDYQNENVIWTTNEGLDQQKKLRDELQKEKEENLVDLDMAREKGDLRENAEYQAAKEKDTNLNNHIIQLSQLILKAQILDLEHVTGDVVTPGTTVTLQREGKKETYTILGYWDTDEKKHIIAYNSPLAKAILGAKEGEERKVELGGEEVQIKILDIQPVK
jgi:transcription elongation factor GreA